MMDDERKGEQREVAGGQGQCWVQAVFRWLPSHRHMRGTGR